ncbi:MAG: hypothetical protein P8M18_12205 [Woeseiaceae bacterium]|nr:hypothetical protein [Woeseiaceae bacterium]
MKTVRIQVDDCHNFLSLTDTRFGRLGDCGVTSDVVLPLDDSP